MVLFGCYRRGDANDPDAYVAAIAAVLAMYEPDLIREVTDPRTGIQTTERFEAFMPNAGELKRYCDAEAARRDRMKHLASLPSPLPAERRLPAPRATAPGSLANTFVPEGHARYARLCEWAAKPDTDPRLWRYGTSSDMRPGIWVGRMIWEGNSEAMPRIKPDDRKLVDEWKALGINIPLNHNGSPISVSLAKQIGLIRPDAGEREAV